MDKQQISAEYASSRCSRIVVPGEINSRLYAKGLPILDEEALAAIWSHPYGAHFTKAMMRIHRDKNAREFVKRLFQDVGVGDGSKPPRNQAQSPRPALTLTPPGEAVEFVGDSLLKNYWVNRGDGCEPVFVCRLDDGLCGVELSPAMHPSHGLSVRFVGGRVGQSRAESIVVTLDKTALLALTAVFLGERNGFDGGHDVDGAGNTLSVIRHADGCLVMRMIPQSQHVISLALPAKDAEFVGERLIKRVRRRYPDYWEQSIHQVLARLLPEKLPGDDLAV